MNEKSLKELSDKIKIMTNIEIFFLVLWIISGLVTSFRVSKPLTKLLMDDSGEGMPSVFAVFLFAIVLAGGCVSATIYAFCVGAKD